MSEEEHDSRSSMETDQQPTPEKKQEDQKKQLQNTEEDKEETVQNGEEEETVESGVKDVDNDTQVPAIPDYKTQKLEIQPLLSHRLKSGDHWYLVDQRWLKQWKKYSGFDSWDQYHAGSEAVNPGPVDNSNLFKGSEGDLLKDHLMEELDYALLPKAAWEKLVSWYGLTPGSREICRHVVEYGTYVKHLKVEVYLFDLKLCVHPHVNDAKQYSFSRADTIKEVEDKARDILEVPSEAEVRMWQRFMTNSYELLKNPEQTLADAGIYGGQLLMLEKKNNEGKWPRDSSGTSFYNNSTSSRTSTGYSSSSSSTSYSGGSSYYGGSYYDRGREPSTPGLCGLSNLGNTCFMNSALQCLGNTEPLTAYFIGKKGGGEKPFIKHINKINPLGMKGALAETYGTLLEEIWSGQNSYLAPRQFKLMIGKHAPQFSGYQQHDSHELLAFLLDGLHEDLNLVKKKPYVDMEMKAEGREDKDLAEETWHKYLLRNQSVIVRQFQGQLKSTLDCPKCHKESRIFDPFMYLSLPLPIQKQRSIFVYMLRADPASLITKYRVTVPKNGSIVDLKEAMQRLTGVDPTKLVIIDVYHSRFHRVYYDRDQISQIMDRDDIYIYELSKPLGDQDWVPIPIYMRELRTHKTFYSSKQVTRYGQVFGLPIVVTVPRKGCTYRVLHDAITTHISRYTKHLSKKDEKKEEEKEEEKEVPTSQDESSKDNPVEEMDVQSTVEPEPSNDAQPVNETPTEQPEDEDKQDEPMDTERKEDKSEEGDDETETEVLFKLVVVNSYGSHELQTLADNDTVLRLTSQTYIACDWELDVKEKCYDVTAAEKIVEDGSCELIEDKRKDVSIYDCMDLFVQKEELGQDDAWYCPRCKDFVQAFKKFDLWKMPDILVVHLKRFSYSRWWRNKIEARIDFPLVGLDLSAYVVNEDDPQPLYDLYAVSNHYGGLGGGHYTAYCKNKESNKWYSFDDSHVSAVDESAICSTSSYVLFYRRCTEGKRAAGSLDRSLSVSFDEELRESKCKFRQKQNSQSMEVDTNRIEEDKEEEGEGEGAVGTEGVDDTQGTNSSDSAFDDSR